MPLPSLIQDSSQHTSTAYDTVWVDSAAAGASQSMEAIMLSQDKIYVVLAVVLIIWIGIAWFIYRTDRRLDRLERSAPSDGSENQGA